MPTAMVTFNGRITLPYNVRKELGLKTGDSVDFVEIEKGRFAILPGTGLISEPIDWVADRELAPIAEQANKTIQ
jgi:antitoxin PrlF